MAWIEPLALKIWFINVLAGDASFFTPIALFLIFSAAAMFKMTGIILGFIVIVFLLMFSGYVPPSLVIFISIVGGLVVGFTIPKIVKR